MKLDIWAFFENMPRKSNFHSNSTRITVTLHQNIFTFMTISICLSAYLSICLSIYLSTYLSIYLPFSSFLYFHCSLIQYSLLFFHSYVIISNMWQTAYSMRKIKVERAYSSDRIDSPFLSVGTVVIFTNPPLHPWGKRPWYLQNRSGRYMVQKKKPLGAVGNLTTVS